jgi:hypothetical protein
MRGATAVNDAPPLTIPRSKITIGAAIAVGLLFVAVFGRGISL